MDGGRLGALDAVEAARTGWGRGVAAVLGYEHGHGDNGRGRGRRWRCGWRGSWTSAVERWDNSKKKRKRTVCPKEKKRKERRSACTAVRNGRPCD